MDPRTLGPSVTVVFFISGHGFGHASREVEIIHALAALRPDVRILIRSAVSPSLLRRTLNVPFDLRSEPCDTGIVQATSVSHDDEATVREAIAFCEAHARSALCPQVRVPWPRPWSRAFRPIDL